MEMASIIHDPYFCVFIFSLCPLLPSDDRNIGNHLDLLDQMDQCQWMSFHADHKLSDI